jgi:hypothetical protein
MQDACTKQAFSPALALQCGLLQPQMLKGKQRQKLPPAEDFLSEQ